MTTEESQPRSRELRDALGKPEDYNTDNQMLLSVPEACKRLGVSRNTLYELINARKLVSVKIGSRRLISPRAVAEYIRKLEEEAKA
jgi:excisionase family DNA binding protein